jgi:hypothetical protein
LVCPDDTVSIQAPPSTLSTDGDETEAKIAAAAPVYESGPLFTNSVEANTPVVTSGTSDYLLAPLAVDSIVLESEDAAVVAGVPALEGTAQEGASDNPALDTAAGATSVAHDAVASVAVMTTALVGADGVAFAEHVGPLDTSSTVSEVGCEPKVETDSISSAEALVSSNNLVVTSVEAVTIEGFASAVIDDSVLVDHSSKNGTGETAGREPISAESVTEGTCMSAAELSGTVISDGGDVTVDGNADRNAAVLTDAVDPADVGWEAALQRAKPCHDDSAAFPNIRSSSKAPTPSVCGLGCFVM